MLVSKVVLGESSRPRIVDPQDKLDLAVLAIRETVRNIEAVENSEHNDERNRQKDNSPLAERFAKLLYSPRNGEEVDLAAWVAEALICLTEYVRTKEIQWSDCDGTVGMLASRTYDLALDAGAPLLITDPMKPAGGWSRIACDHTKSNLEKLLKWCQSVQSAQEEGRVASDPHIHASAATDTDGSVGIPLLESTPPDHPLPLTRHSFDFRSVHWYSKDYYFTVTQAACVEILWHAWEKGTPEVGQAAILEEVGSECKRLRDLFKGRPAWSKRIIAGHTSGAFRLADPPSNK